MHVRTSEEIGPVSERLGALLLLPDVDEAYRTAAPMIALYYITTIENIDVYCTHGAWPIPMFLGVAISSTYAMFIFHVSIAIEHISLSFYLIHYILQINVNECESFSFSNFKLFAAAIIK